MSAREFVLPQISQGPATVEIIEWHVQTNQAVDEGQIIASLDVDDVVVEVAAPCAGRIGLLCGDEGDFVTVGDMLVIFSEATTEAAGNELLLVDSSPRPETATATEIPTRHGPGAVELARELRLELESIATRETDGVITVEDVRRAVEEPPATRVRAWEPLQGARKAMSARVGLAARDAAVATVTARIELGIWAPDDTLQLRLLAAIADACKQVPALNASYDSIRDVSFQNERVNIGLLADIPEGHIAPVINDAASLDQPGLRQACMALRQATRERTLEPEQLHGATITVAMLDAVGGEFAQLPVIPPQVATVACGASVRSLGLLEGQPREHWSVPVSLSFDHRVVSLTEAGAFLNACRASLLRSLDAARAPESSGDRLEYPTPCAGSDPDR